MSDLIKAYTTHMVAEGYSEKSTIIDRSRWLTRADQLLPNGLGNSSREEIETLLATPGLSQWSRCTYYAHLAGLYDWAVSGDDPWMDFSPIAGLKRPRSPEDCPDPITDDELAVALDRSDEHWRRIIYLALLAGLRAGEIRRLDRRHVTAERIRIVSGKGRKTATVPTHADIWAYVKDQPIGEPRTFSPVVAGGPIPCSSAVRRHFDAIDLHDVHLHRFRHRFAVDLLRAGVDIRTVQGLMRHASLATTAAYLPLVEEGRIEAIARLPEPGRRAAPTTRPTAARPSSSQPDTLKSTHRHAA